MKNKGSTLNRFRRGKQICDDFYVGDVETKDSYYLVEVKASNRLQDPNEQVAL